MNKKISYGIGILILAGILFFIFGNNPAGNTVKAQGLVEDGENVKIAANEISKNANWYEYQGVKFFAVKSGSDIKTAFDACDICGGSKGYRQEGNDMVCNNCGNHYPISGIGTANLKGGCWPGYLPREVKDGYVVIKKSDLESGTYRF